MGKFAICRRKMRNFKDLYGKKIVALPVNWQKYKETGKIIYHMNHHTENCRFKWKWFSRDARFKLTHIWVFRPSRATSRLLTHYLNQKEQHFKYHEW